MSHQNFDNYDFVSEKITQNLKDFSNSRARRLKGAKEAGKQAPNTRRNNTSHKDRTQDKEEPQIAGKPESQGDQTAREQDKGASDKGGKTSPNPADPSSGPRKYRILSPLLPRTAEDIEKRRILGQTLNSLEPWRGPWLRRRRSWASATRSLKRTLWMSWSGRRLPRFSVGSSSLKTPSTGSRRTSITRDSSGDAISLCGYQYCIKGEV